MDDFPEVCNEDPVLNNENAATEVTESDPTVVKNNRDERRAVVNSSEEDAPKIINTREILKREYSCIAKNLKPVCCESKQSNTRIQSLKQALLD